MHNGKTALIAGASGLVGSELLSVLLEGQAYGKVKALVRSKLDITHPKLEQIVVDFDRLDCYAEHFNVNDVYCCLGTTIKKAGSQERFKLVDYEYPVAIGRLARSSGGEKFLIITAMGSDPRSKVFYSRVKGEVEQTLKSLGLPELHIFQPSLLLGHRNEFRLGEKIAVWISPILQAVMVGALRKYRPIEAKDVAKAMHVAGQRDALGIHIYSSDQIAILSRNGSC